jgi:hypothetical protein
VYDPQRHANHHSSEQLLAYDYSRILAFLWLAAAGMYHCRTASPSLNLNSPQGFVSGANILDMSKIGIDQGVRSLNSTLVTEAYGRVHAQMVVVPGIMVDGIKPDGSFGQHTGLLYNGNYGTVL